MYLIASRALRRHVGSSAATVRPSEYVDGGTSGALRVHREREPAVADERADADAARRPAGPHFAGDDRQIGGRTLQPRPRRAPSSAWRAVAAAWRTAVPPRVRPVLPPVPPVFGHAPCRRRRR